MPRISFVKLLSVLMLIIGTRELSASTVYAVGTCEPGLQSFTTISAALGATPAPTVVDVCPGTHNEQVEITQGVTLKGVSSGNSAQAIIAPPAGGLVTNASGVQGAPIAAQVWVNNAAGPVIISNITIDAAGNGITGCPPFIAGILDQNTPGTVDHVAIRNQEGNTCGFGIIAEGGTSNPSLTIEHSSIHDFDDEGILSEMFNSTTSELTATIKDNAINGASASTADIAIGQGATSMVNGNILVASTGVYVESNALGSISGNTFVSNSTGVQAGSTGVTVGHNEIVGPSGPGILLSGATPTIRRNTIVASSVGIEFNCNADTSVHSNTLIDATTGLDLVPAGIGSFDSYYDVNTIETGGC